MALIKVKGHEFDLVVARDSFTRRAVQCKNRIVHALRRLGIQEDQTEIVLEAAAFKHVPAVAEWYFDGHRMYFKYEAAGRFVDNLFVIATVIESEVELVLNEEKPLAEFISAFAEEKDVEEQRKEARRTLGVNEDSKDLDEINKRYKELAKAHHPDTPSGDVERFKAVNKAHKILKRELE